MMNKKAAMQQLGALGVGIAALAITLTVVFLLLGGLKANPTVSANGNATAAVDTLTTAAAGLPGWVGILVIGIVGAILLGIVGMYVGGNK